MEVSSPFIQCTVRVVASLARLPVAYRPRVWSSLWETRWNCFL